MIVLNLQRDYLVYGETRPPPVDLTVGVKEEKSFIIIKVVKVGDVLEPE